MTTLFRRSKKPPKTEEELLLAEYRALEKRTGALSSSVKSWRESQLALCKGQSKLSELLKDVAEIQDSGLGADLTESINKITTLRHDMLDDVQLTTQGSILKLHTLFSNMNSVLKKRGDAKSECEKLKKKADRYNDMYPVPVDKFLHAQELHTKALEHHQHLNNNLLNDLRCINKGKYDFFDPCLESLLLSQLNYYARVTETLEPVIDSAQLEETLSAQPHFERLQGLSIVTKPAK